MLAKKFALGFGIAIILPMLVHYGVSTFSSRPKWQDYQVENYYERLKDAPQEERQQLLKEKALLDNQRETAEERFARHLFYAAVPVGIAAIVIGSVVSIQAIGTGLMFGGIFTAVEGYCWYWSKLPDAMRFLSLLLAFGVLLYVGIRKLSK